MFDGGPASLVTLTATGRPVAEFATIDGACGLTVITSGASVTVVVAPAPSPTLAVIVTSPSVSPAR